MAPGEMKEGLGGRGGGKNWERDIGEEGIGRGLLGRGDDTRSDIGRGGIGEKGLKRRYWGEGRD